MFPTLISGTYLECMARSSGVYGRNQGNTGHTYLFIERTTFFDMFPLTVKSLDLFPYTSVQ